MDAATRQRDLGRALEVLLDATAERIRGGPVMVGAGLPFVAPAGSPTLLPLGETATNTAADVTALQRHLDELDLAKADASAKAVTAQNDCCVLRGRIEQLEEENRGLIATVADMSRENASLRAQLAASAPGETASEREKAAAPDAAIEHEDAVGHAPVPGAGAELIDYREICRLLSIGLTSFWAVRKRHGDFPSVAGARGKSRLWRRSEIEAWIARHPDRREPQASASEMLDSRQVCALLAARGENVYPNVINYQRKAHGFPPPAETVGQKHFWGKADVEQWLAARRTAAAPAKSAAGTDVKECGNCADCHQVSRFRVCGSESSPRSKRTVKPDETCDWHRRPGNYRPVRMDEED